MLFLRSLLFFLGQSLSAVFFGVFGVLFAFCPYSFRYRFITTWSHFVIWWAKVVCGVHYRVTGLEHLPQQSAIVLCKHQSAWETLFLQTLLPPQSWVLKKQLLSIPFFGWGLKMLEPIAIDRTKSHSIKQLLQEGKKRLNQNRWVVIFPEGSRIAVGKSGKYSRSGMALAKETGAPIVPIAHNAGVFWPRSAFIKRPGTIELVIGPTIDPSLYTIEEIQQKVRDWIETTTQGLPTA